MYNHSDWTLHRAIEWNPATPSTKETHIFIERDPLEDLRFATTELL